MTKTSAPLPSISERRLRWFHRYARWYLRRNFHGLHLLRSGSFDDVEKMPLLVCLNHPSWWDPLLALELSQTFFANRRHYAPMAAESIAKYKFFERIGFFALPTHELERASRFLSLGQRLLSEPDAALWVTPQGAFTDVRRPVELARGVGHLARRLNRFAMLPVALEYSFWNERFPEAFICMGEPLICEGAWHGAAQWNDIFTRALQQTATTLASHVEARDAKAFEPLLAGRVGVGGVYDLWRGVRARLSGRAFQPGHGGR